MYSIAGTPGFWFGHIGFQSLSNVSRVAGQLESVIQLSAYDAAKQPATQSSRVILTSLHILWLASIKRWTVIASPKGASERRPSRDHPAFVWRRSPSLTNLNLLKSSLVFFVTGLAACEASSVTFCSRTRVEARAMTILYLLLRLSLIILEA